MSNDGRSWFKPFARTGYAARGLVYTVIGVFAVLAAFGAGESKGSHDALQTLLSSGPGDVLAIALMAGMVSYIVWRLIQALFDTDDHGRSFKGLAVRGGLLASAGTYTLLAIYTFGIWRGANSSGSGSGSQEVASHIAGFIGAGTVALILTVIFAGVGLAHFIKAWKKGYARHFRAPANTMQIVHPVARIGLGARGLSFLVIAFLFFYRGLSADSNGGATPGIEDALAFIQGLPFGALLLSAMGVGLIAFALYSFLEAAWRRINVEDADAT